MEGKDVDIKLSKQVAEEAAKQKREIERELERNKDAYIMYLKDTNADREEKARAYRKFGFIGLVLGFTLAFSVALFALWIVKDTTDKTNARIMQFMEEAEFYTEVDLTTDNNSFNTGGINMTKW